MNLLSKLFGLAVLAMAASASLTYKGIDWTSTLSSEANNPTWRTWDGRTGHLETILAASGITAVRQAIFVSDDSIASALALGKRAKAAGFKLYLDFLYSETWTNSTTQRPPQLWRGKNLEQLGEAVRDHTASVLRRFEAEEVPVELVSIGNQIERGILFPLGFGSHGDGQPPADLAGLIKAGIDGVADARMARRPKIALHLSNASDTQSQVEWYDSIVKANKFKLSEIDVQALSFFPFDADEIRFESLRSTVATLRRRYGKEVVLAETAFPMQCSDPPIKNVAIPYSTRGQTEWTKNVIATVEDAGGSGVFVWEPFWKANPSHFTPCESLNWLDEGGVITRALEGFKVLGETTK